MIRRDPQAVSASVLGLCRPGLPVVAAVTGSAVATCGVANDTRIDGEWNVDMRFDDALFVCAAWLEEAGHPGQNLLPRSLGGLVDAAGDLSASRISAILLSESINNVVAGAAAVDIRSVTVGTAQAAPEGGAVISPDGVVVDDTDNGAPAPKG